jgi:hypothetical protein
MSIEGSCDSEGASINKWLAGRHSAGSAKKSREDHVTTAIKSGKTSEKSWSSLSPVRLVPNFLTTSSGEDLRFAFVACPNRKIFMVDENGFASFGHFSVGKPCQCRETLDTHESFLEEFSGESGHPLC